MSSGETTEFGVLPHIGDLWTRALVTPAQEIGLVSVVPACGTLFRGSVLLLFLLLQPLWQCLVCCCGVEAICVFAGCI